MGLCSLQHIRMNMLLLLHTYATKFYLVMFEVKFICNMLLLTVVWECGSVGLCSLQHVRMNILLLQMLTEFFLCLQIRSKLPIVSLPSDTDTLETEMLLLRGRGALGYIVERLVSAQPYKCCEAKHL